MASRNAERDNPFDFSEFSAAAGIRRLIRDTGVCLTFFSRIPLPDRFSPGHAAPSFRRAARAAPIAGGIIGAVASLFLVLAALLGLSDAMVAIITVGALLAITGALHEDGLADTMDGIGGGATRLKKLEIMRDSRIGTFGASALVISILIRVAALSTFIAAFGPARAALLLIAAEAVSRVGAVSMAYAVRPARAQGASFSAGQPTGNTLYEAIIYGALIVMLAGATAIGFWPMLVGLAAVAAATFGMIELARSMLGGQTGDVAGATQQVCLLAFLLAVLIFV